MHHRSDRSAASALPLISRSPIAPELPVVAASGRRHSDPALIFGFSPRGREVRGWAAPLVRFGAMPAAFKVSPTQLVRELLSETEGDREPVRCPDRQNT